MTLRHRRPRTLGGSMFIHNAIEFDYCLTEALQSLCNVCDDVVIVDASSTDGTTDVVLQLAKKLPNLKAVTDVKWEQAPNHIRLSILANIAKSYLYTDWHFMLQADEVIHEQSNAAIRAVIEDPYIRSYFVRRLNFFGDYNHYIKLDQPTENKPCGDTIIRLATIDNNAYSDAESLKVNPAFLSKQYVHDIVIYHYGYVRKDDNHIAKTLSMQSWFYGPNSQPDGRILEMQRNDANVYDWQMLKTRDMFSQLTQSHPQVAFDYVTTRQAAKTIIV